VTVAGWAGAKLSQRHRPGLDGSAAFADLGVRKMSLDLQRTEFTAREDARPTRFMRSLLSLLRTHWDHEPPPTRSRDCGTTLSPSEGERDGVRGFMGSLHGFAIAHCGHEPALRRLGRAPQFVATTSQRRSAETPL